MWSWQPGWINRSPKSHNLALQRLLEDCQKAESCDAVYWLQKSLRKCPMNILRYWVHIILAKVLRLIEKMYNYTIIKVLNIKKDGLSEAFLILAGVMIETDYIHDNMTRALEVFFLGFTLHQRQRRRHSGDNLLMQTLRMTWPSWYLRVTNWEVYKGTAICIVDWVFWNTTHF